MPADPERCLRRQACVYRRGFAYRQNCEHTSGLRPRFNYQTYRWEIKTLTCGAGKGGGASGAHADQHAGTQQMTGRARTEYQNTTEERKRRFWRRTGECWEGASLIPGVKKSLLWWLL